MCHLQKQSLTLQCQTVSGLCKGDTSVAAEWMYVAIRFLEQKNPAVSQRKQRDLLCKCSGITLPSCARRSGHRRHLP